MTTPSSTLSDYNNILPAILKTLAKENANAYQNASPYPHIVLDDLFPENILDHVIEEFPDPNDSTWHKFNNDKEVKLASLGDEVLGPYTRAFINNLNSGTFINFLEELTGIKGLISDPQLAGAGMHRIMPGGKLGIHADFNKHDHLDLDRRLNVLVYLNKDWDESYGGHFELWNHEMTEAVVKLLPIFNRMALFSTTSTSWHGHPNPLTCPEDRSRRSIALYYYTVGRPGHEVNDPHSTLFKERPGETFKGNREPVTGRFKEIIKDFIPPFFLKLKNRNKEM